MCISIMPECMCVYVHLCCALPDFKAPVTAGTDYVSFISHCVGARKQIQVLRKKSQYS